MDFESNREHGTFSRDRNPSKQGNSTGKYLIKNTKIIQVEYLKRITNLKPYREFKSGPRCCIHSAGGHVTLMITKHPDKLTHPEYHLSRYTVMAHWRRSSSVRILIVVLKSSIDIKESVPESKRCVTQKMKNPTKNALSWRISSTEDLDLRDVTTG